MYYIRLFKLFFLAVYLFGKRSTVNLTNYELVNVSRIQSQVGFVSKRKGIERGGYGYELFIKLLARPPYIHTPTLEYIYVSYIVYQLFLSEGNWDRQFFFYPLKLLAKNMTVLTKEQTYCQYTKLGFYKIY